jgi:Ser/Thr protein kinase RdoA (MazF antagonist)
MIEIQHLQQELQRRVPSYFPELGDARFDLQVVHHHQRRFSHALSFRLASKGQDHRLFVKIPVEAQAQKQASIGRSPREFDRPRLIPIQSVNEEVQWEYTALMRMKAHFDKFNGHLHGSPKPIDLIDGKAIVVECITEPTLSQQLQSRSTSRALNTTLRNVGAWLCAFHQMPAAPESQSRLLTRHSLSKLMDQCVLYLQQQSEPFSYLRSLQNTLRATLPMAVPEQLEPVCGHGDFGPHNVFIHHDGRVTGFDTLANWQTSRFEDLAYFLLLLEMSPPWFCPRRLPESYRIDFLRGYFGDAPIPHQLLAWFEVLVTLEKWVSLTHSSQTATGAKRQVKRLRLALQRRWLKSRIQQLLNPFLLPIQSSLEVSNQQGSGNPHDAS